MREKWIKIGAEVVAHARSVTSPKKGTGPVMVGVLSPFSER